MYGSNPYAQAGWANPNPHAVGRLSSWDSQQVSPTFGALPANAAVQSPHTITFRFSGPDTLNCSVIGPQNEGLMRISTSAGQQRVTSFTAANGTTFATVEWALQPLITVSGLVPRQEAMKWLLFSADRRSAGMTIGQDMYIWLFQGQSIYLHKSHGVPGERLAKMYYNNGLCLDVNVTALRGGLLEVFLVAAALLQSRQESRA
ncbi:hypothetical protein BKA70DRAFT_1428523 [Coprinopsis sp. MPI-PUGE-AT-0042]|nr:hypothetical protein BKA70DRAFT_1115681 [Coprinopsis sp. MPI-PUGE-AT-0042]KAH6907011.1 hypothetical protein BKA70DRAFT_1428523 [Coprinopsis sp. MPI-PUGE-AT-0042]